MTTEGADPWPGRARPLGATWDGDGTNFAIASDGAEGVELCLFDDVGEHRLPLRELTDHVWHGYVPGVRPGQRYGFRCAGPFHPEWGARWNPAKLLLDPYARAISGDFVLDDAVFGHVGRDDRVRDDRDSAPYVPRSVVTHSAPAAPDDTRPQTAWSDTVIYELHVRGFTMRRPDVDPSLRGTYAGLAHPAVIDHLTGLGVTAVELLPVHHFVSEPDVVRRGRTNFWGYNTIGYFAPHAAYSASGSHGQQVDEFKAMVAALHAAGIEVILDVVFNHTAEGDELGPTLSFRGIDNGAYYQLLEGDARRYANHTGTGNTVNTAHPFALRLLLDSLRYWITEMHVDGFRFDLAAALARPYPPGRFAAIFDVISQDPVIGSAKLIGEPWDIGADGYRLGQLPPPWSEWNGRYRDTLRDFWRGSQTDVAEVAYRLSGSSDLFRSTGRRPHASINYVTAHDGFTLRDLVSYETKHNEVNGEDNADGDDHNRSWNCGVEGETDDDGVRRLRRRQQRNLLTTLLLSAGVPMLTAGDEISRTQRGNNNAYCLDDETSWVDWGLAEIDDGRALLEFTRALLALRGDNPVFRPTSFFVGRATPESDRDTKDIEWFTRSGDVMTPDDWTEPSSTIGMFLDGAQIHAWGARGERITGASYLLCVHAGSGDAEFRLPGRPWASSYDVVLDTADDGPGDPRCLAAGALVPLLAHSAVLLRANR